MEDQICLLVANVILMLTHEQINPSRNETWKAVALPSASTITNLLLFSSDCLKTPKAQSKKALSSSALAV
jgi:hypothetical protein